MQFVLNILIYMLVIIPSLTLHEYMHGRVAYALGDDTARNLGRLTLNPISHIDPLGTIAVPLMLSLAGAPVIGWAKPVPVNPYRFEDPRRAMMLTGAAGPLTNLIIAFFAGLLIRSGLFALGSVAFDYFFILCYINIVLAMFNSVPVPPLDGSRVISGLLPREMAAKYNHLQDYGMAIIFLLIFVFGALFWEVLSVFINFFLRLFTWGLF
ncbi:MAG: site-2 protease family protein [Actinomycetota bacterium]|nr:site-2 protease family protein [Actinomycetota bacterium]